MKVVLFCGGQGMRLREFSDKITKSMVPIGYRPIIWYIMKYYAHFGHKDFILCLGYLGDSIKNYFVNYDEYLSNDFVYSKGGNKLSLLNKDIDDWTITFADTGINASLGERLLAVKKYLKGEKCFLTANRSEEHTSELQSHSDLVCRLLLEKKKSNRNPCCRTSNRQYRADVPS